MAHVKFCLICLFLWFSFSCGQDTGDEDCECVPYYLCQNGTINTNGENIIDIRMRPDDCSSYFEICCKKKDMLEEPITRSPPVVKKTSCGYRNPNGVGFRIAGDIDNEAAFGEFPWTINIMQKNSNNEKYSYRCGGSLIHPQVVLTAAHCIKNAKKVKVRAGEWDTQTIQEIFQHQERSVKSIVIHRDYKKRDLFNDVSLLFLDSPFNISENEQHINVVCLPTQGHTISSDGCFVNGWGKNKFENGNYQNIMKKVELPIVERNACEQAFRKTRLGKRFKLHRSFICAGGEEGQDACTGDGGGPLVCPIPGSDNRYQQVGIVAWGIGCGTGGVPGAYVDVSLFRDWIDRQMTTENFDTKGYTNT